jgi:rhamnosyltransferase
MNYSVIILTLNSENRLRKLLPLIREQSLQPEKTLVIDSSSNDKTCEVARENNCDIVVINRKDFDHGGTRTIAGKLLNSDILLYLTDDVIPYNNIAFEKLISVFKDDNIGAAFGRQIPYPETNIFGKHLRYFNYPDFSYIREYKDRLKYGIKTIFLSDSFCAYRKASLEKIGWFKEGLIVGEDNYAGAKLVLDGYKICYVGDAIVYHSHNYSAIDEFKRYFDIGVFHRTEKWILDEFGKAEGEGIKYVKSGIKFLIDNDKIYLLPEFFLRIFLKYLGYKLGYNYKFLPDFFIKILSMHKNWWMRNQKKF